MAMFDHQRVREILAPNPQLPLNNNHCELVPFMFSLGVNVAHTPSCLSEVPTCYSVVYECMSFSSLRSSWIFLPFPRRVEFCESLWTHKWLYMGCPPHCTVRKMAMPIRKIMINHLDCLVVLPKTLQSPVQINLYIYMLYMSYIVYTYTEKRMENSKKCVFLWCVPRVFPRVFPSFYGA